MEISYRQEIAYFIKLRIKYREFTDWRKFLYIIYILISIVQGTFILLNSLLYFNDNARKNKFKRHYIYLASLIFKEYIN